MFGLCLREKMKPGKEHIRYINCVWATVDVGPDGYSGKEKHFSSDKQAEVAIRDFDLPPSIRVKSGRGTHLYWLLHEPQEITDLEKIESVLRKISNYFQCGSDVGIDATLRLPGTSNPKYSGPGTRCYLEQLEPAMRYSLEDFENLDLRIIIPSKRAPVLPKLPPLPPSRVRVIREPEQIPQAEIHSPERPIQAGANSNSGPPGQIDDETIRKLGNHLAEAFSDQFLDRLADRIVERLVTRLGKGGHNPDEGS